MRSGKLCQRIDIDRPIAGVDTSGGNTLSWDPFQAGYPAKRRNLSGTTRRATAVAGGEYAETRVEWEMRYLPGLTPSMRIRHGGEVFKIRAVLDVEERHRTHIVITDVGVSDG
ncbi:MAG: head-tail adaptor protein [Lautropia sp.]